MVIDDIQPSFFSESFAMPAITMPIDSNSARPLLIEHLFKHFNIIPSKISTWLNVQIPFKQMIYICDYYFIEEYVNKIIKKSQTIVQINWITNKHPCF